MSALAESAARYATLGYNVLPCRPDDKRPANEHGCTAATNDEFQVAAFWDAIPNANVGISAAGLIIVDRDVLPDGSPNPWPEDSKQRESLYAGPVVKTPRGGSHHYFRAPAGRHFRNSSNRVAHKVDIRATGGYVVAPPSTVNGTPYQWVNELDCSPDKLPMAPDWIVQRIAELEREERQPAPAKRRSEFASDAAVFERARKYLATIEPAISGSGGHDRTFRAACRLVLGFDLSIDDALILLTEWSSTCQPPWSEKELRHKVEDADKQNGERGYLRNVAPENYHHVPMPNHDRPQIVQPPEDCEKPTALTDPGRFPDHLLDVPGVIGEFSKWVLDGAIRKQPVLTLAAGIALMGTLTGRKVKTSTNLRSNVYCVGLCGSGGGKDRVHGALKTVFSSAGHSEYIPFEDLMSGTALVNGVANQPCCLLPIDEFGKFLAVTRDATNNPHRAEIINNLMKLYSQSAQLFYGRGYADITKIKQIEQPNVCVYGTSVRESVLGSLTEENLTDGFVSRMLIFETNEDNPRPNRSAVFVQPPDTLIDAVKQWCDYIPGEGNLAAMIPQPRLVADSPAVSDLFWDADEEFHARKSNDVIGSGVWTRTAEKARKLALLYQCSAEFWCEEISLAAAEWGLAVSEHLTHRIVLLANDWIADNRQGRLVNKILRGMRSADGELPLWRISRLLQKDARPKEVREILDMLTQAGTIKFEATRTKGRSGNVFRLQ